jgi:ribose/xylose/arabinose/galactoside ABC-type transport system permease subunit
MTKKLNLESFDMLRFARRYGTVLFGVLVFIFFSIFANNFLTVHAQLILLRQMSMLTIVALGFTFVMAAGGFDMSVGNAAGLINITFGGVLIYTNSLLLSILAAVGVGLAVGLTNGTLVAYIGIPDFIGTFSVGIITVGIKMLISRGHPTFFPTDINPAALFIGQGRIPIGDIPFPVVLMLVLVVLVYFIMKKTTLGRRIYAVGGNKVASQYGGINVKKYRLITFLISGFMLSIASIVLTSRLGSAQPLAGEEFLLDTIAAVFLSTTMFGEGEPTPLGTFVGAFIITMLTGGLTMMGVPYFYQYITKGSVVILSVMLSVVLNAKLKS